MADVEKKPKVKVKQPTEDLRIRAPGSMGFATKKAPAKRAAAKKAPAKTPRRRGP